MAFNLWRLKVQLPLVLARSSTHSYNQNRLLSYSCSSRYSLLSETRVDTWAFVPFPFLLSIVLRPSKSRCISSSLLASTITMSAALSLSESPTKRKLCSTPVTLPNNSSPEKKLKMPCTADGSENTNSVGILSEVSENRLNKDKASSPVTPTAKLYFAKLTENAYTPTKGSKFAAGYDLKSAYEYVVPQRGSCLVKTDIQIQLPSGTYGRVAPRSGLALKNKIDVGAGVIDEDYRGNIGVVLFNHSEEDFQIAKGDRVAQLICEKICYPEVVEVKSLDDTERGDGGFGSTGVKSD